MPVGRAARPNRRRDGPTTIGEPGQRPWRCTVRALDLQCASPTDDVRESRSPQISLCPPFAVLVCWQAVQEVKHDGDTGLWVVPNIP